jgi:hypothetical protein
MRHLLRHCQASSNPLAMQQLEARWPKYEKPMTSDQLGRRIDGHYHPSSVAG